MSPVARSHYYGITTLADINGDGYPEILTTKFNSVLNGPAGLLSYLNAQLIAFDRYGNMVRSWNLLGANGEAPDPLVYTAVGDFNHDGLTEIALQYGLGPAFNSTLISILSTGAQFNSAASDWPMQDQNPQNTSVLLRVAATNTTLVPLQGGVYANQPSTFSITVSAATQNSNALTGVANLLDGSRNVGSCILTSGTCMISATLSAGSHNLIAGYVGDKHFGLSYSAALTQQVQGSLPAATPAFSVAPGTYTSAQTVLISDSTPGATIYYTTNGSMPTTGSTLYTGTITVSSTETLQAIATASGYSTSPVATAAYTINLPAATPAFSVAPGTYTSAQLVSISDSTPGATIYYTINGSMPTTGSTLYTGAITVSSTETLQAIAIASGYSTSAIATAAYTINLPAATPAFSVVPGTYTSAQAVLISDSTPGATIYYTTNGSTPTTGSVLYSGAITVSSTETLRAIATASGYSTSPVATAAYTINLSAATPAFSVVPGTYTSAQAVLISDSTPGATIYYTTNGSTPTTGSALYTGAITVSSTETLQAIAIASGYSTSAIATAAYTINLPAATPAFSVAPGTYTSAQLVSISDSTPGATIYYTTNGSTPTTSSALYSGAITVSSTETLQAIAIASGYSTSGVSSGTYTISTPSNPAPVISNILPGFTGAAGTALTLVLNGSGFTPGSILYWGTSALATQYISATQLTAQVTAADIESAGVVAITVQTPSPGGGTSNSFEFEVDSMGSGATAPNFTSRTAAVAAGSTASYAVTLPSTVTGATATCLNLPAGAACSYSSATNTVTISTSSKTPEGTYPVTVVFSETVSGAATAGILLPFLLFPLMFIRKRVATRGIWTACFGLVLLSAAAFSTGCGGGSFSVIPPPINQTHQVTSSGSVSLTIQ